MFENTKSDNFDIVGHTIDYYNDDDELITCKVVDNVDDGEYLLLKNGEKIRSMVATIRKYNEEELFKNSKQIDRFNIRKRDSHFLIIKDCVSKNETVVSRDELVSILNIITNR